MLLDLNKGQITKANKRHNRKFSPKYRAFCILQNKIEDVVNKSTQLWKSIYKTKNDVYEEEYKVEASTKRKEEKEIGKREEEKKGEEKKKEEEKKGEEEKVEVNKEEEEEKTTKGEENVTDEQEEQSVQDKQMPPPSPPHATITPTETIIVKDVTDTSCQNINPLTTEDLDRKSVV